MQDRKRHKPRALVKGVSYSQAYELAVSLMGPDEAERTVQQYRESPPLKARSWLQAILWKAAKDDSRTGQTALELTGPPPDRQSPSAKSRAT